ASEFSRMLFHLPGGKPAVKIGRQFRRLAGPVPTTTPVPRRRRPMTEWIRIGLSVLALLLLRHARLSRKVRDPCRLALRVLTLGKPLFLRASRPGFHKCGRLTWTSVYA